jgi:hypothetical protein
LGGTSDVWGATLTSAIVKDAGFGVSVWSTDTTNTLAIDFVTLAVEYTTDKSAALTGSASTSAAGTVTPSGAKPLTGDVTTASSGTVTAVLPRAHGQQIDSAQGTLTYTVETAAEEALAGEEATAAAGTHGSARFVGVRSRKAGGGSATHALSGQMMTSAFGLFTPTPVRTPTGQVAALLGGSISGKTFSKALSGSAVTSTQGNVTAPSLAPSGTLPAFRVNSAIGGTSLPFAFGHVFRQGDVPSGQVALGTGGTDWQCSPLTFWSDGSLRHAVIAGRATCTSGVDKSITLSSATNPGGTALTEADLASALSTVNITAGAFTWTVNASVGTADRHRTVCFGPVMSNFIYRKPVAGHNHLVLWADVRLYVGGNVEIFPWVENAYLTAASPTNDIRTYTVTIGGVTRFTQSIDVKHHTRVPLLSGVLSYWTGTDPQITPKHDAAYLKATKMVPNYADLVPSSTTLNALQQTYAPNTLAGMTQPMDNAGGSGDIIPNPQVFYITSSGDARAYNAAIVRGLAGGSYSIHYRDDSTNDIIKFGSYPNASLDGTSTPAIPAGTGGSNGTWGTNATTHQPSFGYLPFIITGRWWFWEESAFWTTYNYLQCSAIRRRGEATFGGPYYHASGSAGVADTRNGAYANRGAHWQINRISQTLALCPTSHPTYSDWITAWEANAEFYKATYVDGTFGSNLVSPQGILGGYARYPVGSGGSNAVTVVYGEGFENNYGPLVWGFAFDLGLPQSAASLSRHSAVRNHAYKQVTTRAGSGAAGTYNWRRFGVFAYPLGPAIDSSQSMPASWYTGAQSLAALETGFSLGSLPATLGLSLKNHSSDNDMAAGSSTANDYFPAAMASLAYAMEHGADEAADGWARITGASNFAPVLSALSANPHFAVEPRSPAWRAGQAVNAWREIASSSMSLAPPTVVTGGSNVKYKVDAWNGMQIDTRTNTIWTLATGGHGDWWGNEVMRLRLSDNEPRWSEHYRASQPSAFQTNAAYYTDGHPASSHTYYSQHFIRARNRAMRFGVGGAAGASTFTTPHVDGFNSNAVAGVDGWDPAGTWASVPGITFAMISSCKDETTEDVYWFRTNAAIYKWTQATATWSTLTTNIPKEMQECASAFDTTRNRIFAFKGRDATVCYTIDPTTGVFTARTITGSAASTIAAAEPFGFAMVYVPPIDGYVLRFGAGGGALYRIDANTFEATAIAMTGGTSIGVANSTVDVAGIYQRLLYAPSLQGVVYIPRYSSNAWFARLY